MGSYCRDSEYLDVLCGERAGKRAGKAVCARVAGTVAAKKIGKAWEWDRIIGVGG